MATAATHAIPSHAPIEKELGAWRATEKASIALPAAPNVPNDQRRLVRLPCS